GKGRLESIEFLIAEFSNQRSNHLAPGKVKFLLSCFPQRGVGNGTHDEIRMTNAEGKTNDVTRSPRAFRIGKPTRPACGSLRARDNELLWKVRDSRKLSESPVPETGALPGNFKWAGRMPAGPTARMAVLLACLVPLSISAAPKNRSAMQVPGYRAVCVHYGPMNKMIMSVRINAQPANLLVATGSNQLILDAEAAELFGVRPSPRGLLYLRSTKIE